MVDAPDVERIADDRASSRVHAHAVSRLSPILWPQEDWNEMDVRGVWLRPPANGTTAMTLCDQRLSRDGSRVRFCAWTSLHNRDVTTQRARTTSARAAACARTPKQTSTRVTARAAASTSPRSLPSCAQPSLLLSRPSRCQRALPDVSREIVARETAGSFRWLCKACQLALHGKASHP